MASRESKWRLQDVVDFEVLLRPDQGAGPLPGGSGRYREAVRGILEKREPRTEGERRRIGLRAWLEARRAGEEAETGERVVGGLRLAGILFGLLAFVAGVGLMRGMLVDLEHYGRAYHLWIFLAAALGLQWLFLLGGLLGYLFVRRESGALSLIERGVAWLARKMSGFADGEVWKSLLRGGKGYRPVASWRVARMVQGTGVLYNLGLMAGFFGCLWFLKIGFFWESSLPALSGPRLMDLMNVLGAPWTWLDFALPPRWDAMDVDLLDGIFHTRDGWEFLLMCLAVWGLLPRVLLWFGCLFREKRALAGLPFQEPRHRELWRELTRVERSLPASGPADGVVLLDVGGIGVETEALRGFLLRELRVNPEARYTASVLDEEREAEAWEAIAKAPLGVVFLVEGWALSPKQMNAHYERVRAVDKERLVRFVVLGPVEDGKARAPSTEDLAQWKTYVDGLRDPAAEVIAYREREVAA